MKIKGFVSPAKVKQLRSGDWAILIEVSRKNGAWKWARTRRCSRIYIAAGDPQVWTPSEKECVYESQDYTLDYAIVV